MHEANEADMTILYGNSVAVFAMYEITNAIKNAYVPMMASL